MPHDAAALRTAPRHRDREAAGYAHGPAPRDNRAHSSPAGSVECPLWSASTSTTMRPRRSTPGCWRRCCRCSATGFGNASSLHWFGQRARAAVDDARGEVASLIGASPAEIVFTGGGTEADNLALRGVAAAAREPRRKVALLRDRAPRGRAHRARAGGGGRARAGGARGRRGTAGPGRPARQARRADGRGGGDARQQRDRRPPGRRPRSCGSATSGARSSIATRCRRRARFRWTSARWKWTCWRSPRTRSTARRAWARCTCAAARA